MRLAPGDGQLLNFELPTPEINGEVPGSATLHLLEQVVEGAADFELFRASLHVHDLISAKVAADLLHRVDSNHGGTMDLPEFGRVEFVDQFLVLPFRNSLTIRLQPGLTDA